MDRGRYVLAVMAAGEESARYAPVQVQKLFFLMDREVAKHTGGPYFSFSPYDYGPFDSSVYDEIERQRHAGRALIDKSGFYRHYSLTSQGYALGQKALNEFTPQGRKYATEASKWVRSLSFDELVSKIYNRYPEMNVNSVFR
jgi:hypothetical protein